MRLLQNANPVDCSLIPQVPCCFMFAFKTWEGLRTYAKKSKFRKGALSLVCICSSFTHYSRDIPALYNIKSETSCSKCVPYELMS